MRPPAQLHKARNQRFRKRAADFEDRKPFERFPLWLRLLSSLPLPAWYGIASFLAFILDKVMKSRHEIIDMQLAACFPDRDADWIRDTRSAFFRNFADVSVEIIKAVTIAPEEIDRRVTFENAGAAQRGPGQRPVDHHRHLAQLQLGVGAAQAQRRASAIRSTRPTSR